MLQPQIVCETYAETYAVEYLRLGLSSFLACYGTCIQTERIDLKHNKKKKADCLDMDLHVWALSAGATGYCCARFWSLHNHFQDFLLKRYSRK